jgi:hypothetical protein
VVVDTDGHGLVLEPHPADVQTGMVRRGSYACRGARSPSSSKPSPTVAMLVRRRPRPPPSASRLSGSRPIRWGLRSIRAAGWLNGSSRGSVETDGSGRIRRRRSRQLGPSSMLRPSWSSSAAWDGTHDYRTYS